MSMGKFLLCRAVHLPELNQQAMMGIRDQWFEEVGGAPNGNRCELIALHIITMVSGTS